MDFIPMHTDEYKLAFCAATDSLNNDIKQVIWNDTLDITPMCPGAPMKRRSATAERLATIGRKHIQF